MAAYLDEYAQVQSVASLLLGLPDDAPASAVLKHAEPAGHWAGVAMGRALRQRQTRFDRPDVDALPLVQRARAALRIQQCIEEGTLGIIRRGIDESSTTGVSYYDFDVQVVTRFEPYYDEAPEFWFEAASTDRPSILRYYLVDECGDIRVDRLSEHSAFQHELLSDAEQQRRFITAAATVNQYQYIHWIENLVDAGDIELLCEYPDLSNIDVTEDVKEALDTLFA
jgi:hypothetical protein